MYVAQRPSRSETLPLRLHQYHVRLWGRPQPGTAPLVLVHGWMDVAASYQFMVEALDQRFLDGRLIIAPDWRGFGLTTGPACDHYDFPDYLADLDALLDHYVGDQPVDLVGHSMGGHVAMIYAGARPQRIRRLVNLEGFGMPAARAGQAPNRYAQWMDEIKSLHAGKLALKTYDDAAGVAARLMKTNPRLPPDRAQWLAQVWARPQIGDDGTQRWAVLGDAAHRVINPHLFRVDEIEAVYSQITRPVLMVEGSDDSLGGWWKDRYTLAEFHQRLQAVPACPRVVLPDSGHMLHHDQPVALAKLIEEFLAG